MKRHCPLRIMVTTALLLASVVWQATAQERSPALQLGNLAQPSRGNNSFGGEELVPAGPIAPGPPQLAPAPEPGAPPGSAAADISFLTLQDAIQAAIRCNPDLRAAEHRTQIADAILARARSEFYPRLGISEDYAATNNAAQGFMYLLEQGRFSPNINFNNPGVVDDFHTQLLVQQGVYAGGRRVAETEAAAANRQAACFGLAAVQNELVFHVAEAYYRVFQARELAAVRQQSVRQVEQHLEIVRARERADAAVKSDVLTVQVRLAEVKEALITARHQHDLAWAVLENVCGTRIEQRVLPRELPAAPWSEHVQQVETVVAEAQSQRPEVGQMSIQVQAADRGVRAAQAGKYPTVNLNADYDVFTPDLVRGNDSWFVGVVVNFTLFDGKRTRNDVRQAEARLQEIRARQQRLLLDIELGVRRTWLQLEDAKQRLEVTSQTIGQAQESLREIEQRYGGQIATITQLVDAQVALSNAMVRRTTALAEVEIARAALEQATGRLREVVGR